MFFEGSLKKIRQRTNEEKNAFAFMAALLITCLVAIFWLFNLVTGFSQGGEISKESKASLIASPLEVIRNQFRTVIDNDN